MRADNGAHATSLRVQGFLFGTWYCYCEPVPSSCLFRSRDIFFYIYECDNAVPCCRWYFRSDIQLDWLRHHGYHGSYFFSIRICITVCFQGEVYCTHPRLQLLFSLELECKLLLNQLPWKKSEKTGERECNFFCSFLQSERSVVPLPAFVKNAFSINHFTSVFFFCSTTACAMLAIPPIVWLFQVRNLSSNS